jgi:N-acetylglutamate synthase-like GNAT family acetyltransferase/DNA-binding MarR family transcriptional regulator
MRTELTNTSRNAGILLREVIRAYTRAQREVAADCGATATQCHILTGLDRSGPISMVELGRRLGFEKSWVSRVTESMIARRLVRKIRNRADARSRLVSLTAQGRRRAGSLNSRLQAHSEKLLQSLTDSQRSEIERSLLALCAVLMPGTELDPTEKIRLAVESDWPDIERLLQKVALPIAGARANIDEFLVAARGNKILGCAAIEVYGTIGLLRSVAVVPDLQRTGLGRKLTERLFERARSQGIRTLYLLTTTAASYFERLGFKLEARSNAPGALRASEEFRGACPDSARFLRLELRKGTRRPMPKRA